MIPLVALQGYASQYAGTPVVISCTAPPVTAANLIQGYTIFIDGKATGVIYLPAETCNRLEHLDTGNEIVPADVLVLAHEAQHIALESGDECLVERTALANEWGLLKLFRLAAWRARAVLAGAMDFHRSMPAIYHPDALGAC